MFYLLISAFSIIILLAITGTLFLDTYHLKKRSFFLSENARHRYSSHPDSEATGQCPICKSVLSQSEKLHSIIYENQANKDAKCKILGCPYCYPQAGTHIKRVCPVCKKELPRDGFLISSLYEHKTNRHHVHVSGCTLCSKVFLPKT
ncbi:MAG: hypothetical protein ACRC5H_09935 [Treponemataceae bacterium]